MAYATPTSTQDVLTAIAFNGAICIIFVFTFFALRLKLKRIYEPKSYYDFLPEEQRPKPLSPHPIQLIIDLVTKDHKFIINQAGVNGYLFIRYLFISSATCLVGMLTWIILLPVTATGSTGNTGLNKLSISNIKSTHRYYAHAFMSWFFYGGVMFVLFRELQFYCNLKFAVMSTPYYAKSLASRTVMFESVPIEYRNEEEFFKLYNGVKKVWVARGHPDLSKKVREREALCMKLETALNGLLQRSYQSYLKAKERHKITEPINDISYYIPPGKRPTIKLSKFNPFAKQHDLMDYCLEKIPELNREIAELQAINMDSIPMNSIVVEFENQYYAQMAYQVVSHNKPLHFIPSEICVEPAEIFWPNMRVFWWESLIRRGVAILVLIILTVFWVIPVAFVGFVSNITYLTNQLPWLNFIYNLPNALLGLITSLLPTILLSLLVMMLPIFIRITARFYGCKTTQAIEYFTQQAYFTFQLIQTVLIVTLTSAAASVITQIIDDPDSVLPILSDNVPKASNFFISYIILQGFSVSSASLSQIIPIISLYGVGYILDNSLRKKWNKWSSLGSYPWGTTFPVYTTLFVIVLAYSIISPIILLFGFVAFSLTWITHLYNANFVTGKGSEFVGLFYPRAIFQTMNGIIFGQNALIYIYAVSEAWGCIALQCASLAVTTFFHFQMNSAFDHLKKVVPSNVMKPLDGETETNSWSPSSNSKKNEESPFYSSDELASDTFSDVPLLVDGDSHPIKFHQNWLLKFVQPWIYLSYSEVKKYLPDSMYELPSENVEESYANPDISAKCPVLWIPRDPMGLSGVLIEKFKGVIEISDENSEFDQKGRFRFTGPIPTRCNSHFP